MYFNDGNDYIPNLYDIVQVITGLDYEELNDDYIKDLYNKLNPLMDDDDKPFKHIEKADYLAEMYMDEIVYISTEDGLKRCKTEKSNAWQPNSDYNYFFIEIK